MNVPAMIREAKEKGLTVLDLSGTEITEMPKEIWQLTNLTILDLRGIPITEIPKEIGQLTNLEKLNLSRTQIREIPKEVWQLTNLKLLGLGGTQIKELSREITQLTSLKELYLWRTQIKELPKEITQLTNLAVLDLSGTQIKELPKDITQLTNLEVLQLDGSHLVNPPVEIVKKGIKAIRNYFNSVEEGETQKLYEAKLIIVGQGGVGKTCLTRKLIDNGYNINTKEATTEGIAIENWNWKWHLENKTVEFKANIWDFGGQEIYHATHQFFLTKRSLYLFVWDARKEEDYSFDYWLNVVSLLSDTSPIIIILNKADERIKEIDQASLQEKFKNIAGFHKVSCLDGRGVEELTRQIKEEVAKLPHVGNDWPGTWTKIRKELENDKRQYIEYDEYIEMCKNYSLNEEKANYLSSFLHDLGVILHFQDDDILRNIVILKPEWGTNAVYKVLDTRKVQENKGKFKFSDLSGIWKDKYPSQKYGELLQLMMKFELCFKLAGPNEYMIPELLPSEKPECQWNYENNLRFEYHYEFMPSGITTRFIVRNHHLIEENIYWRNGVMLNNENTRAFVVSEPFNRKIKIYIDGVEKKELLAIIRCEFEYIHKTLNNPAVKEMIPCTCAECSKEEPTLYSYKELKKFIRNNVRKIPCGKSCKIMDIEELISGIEEKTSVYENKKQEEYIARIREKTIEDKELKKHNPTLNKNYSLVNGVVEKVLATLIATAIVAMTVAFWNQIKGFLMNSCAEVFKYISAFKWN